MGVRDHLRRGDEESEHVFRIAPDLTHAEPKALEINRYRERTTAPDWTWDDPDEAALQMHFLLDGAILIGSNVAFDAGFFSKLFIGRFTDHRPWHYRPICVATLAAGYLHGRGMDAALDHPWRSYELSSALGVEPPAPDVAHTALGDARWARDVYDAATSNTPTCGRALSTGQPCPDHQPTSSAR